MSERRPNPLAWMMPLSALALAAGILLGRGAETGWQGMAALVGTLLAVGLSRGRARRAFFLLAVVSVGFLRGYAAYHSRLPEEGDYLVTGVVADEVRFRENGQARTILRQATLDGQSLSSGVYWTGYPDALPEEIAPGATVSVAARVYHPSAATNPNGFDFREYLLQQDITIGLYGMDDVGVAEGRFSLEGWAARVRQGLTARLTAVMGEEAGGYAAAMLLGNRELIASEDRDAFNRLGIAHVLSVSGYHVGVLAGVLAWLFRRLRLRQGLRLAVTAAVLAGYCLLTGMHPPVVRAAVLVVCYRLGRLQQRQNIGLHLLSASAVLMLLISPAQLTGAGFQLTYGAMLGLLLVLPALERLPVLRDSRWRKLWLALCATLAAQLGILLPQTYWFQELPLLALPLNIIVLAGAGTVILLYWLVLALLPVPMVSLWLGSAAGWITERLLDVIRWLGHAEGIVLRVKQANVATFLGWVLLVAGMSILWTKRRRWPVLLGAAIMALSLVPWPYTGTSYIQFDVGSADAALLRDQDMVILVDVGEDGNEAATYLRQQRLSVDLLFLTHLHSDHAGGVQALLDNGIPIKTVCLPVGAESAAIDEEMLLLLEALDRAGTEVRVLARGDTVALPNGLITVIWPEEGKVRAGMDANLHSLVLHAQLRGTTMLLTGDLDGAYERYAAVPSDILKIAHHGSKSSTSAAFLNAVAPEMLILSCGDETRQESMAERGGEIPLYGTREFGAIMIDFDDDGYTVHTMR